ncbi:anthranilate synthase component 2 [Loigolactobacillus backii]|uniref:anthranilate synthase component II n=1 Tax=Loigolactobacillus backii TaxID=375175 RepID=UPI0007F08C28|nr:aminodeoxychorismate/anthranilate synthase component II [Loigolactobacillus backii]ANK63799.1 anthranilate synthase component 2 [Loigolactobacillus backii]
MLLIIDNYDSFTYNLYQLVGQMTQEEVRVVKNDQLTTTQIADLNPSGIILSPGPGRPEDAGVTLAVVEKFAGKIPLFGVCLGHQAICVAYGGQVVAAAQLMHGKPSEIMVQQASTLFNACPTKFQAARYHSLIAAQANFPTNLQITAKTAKGEIMALADEEHQVYGVQFHPESIMTDETVGHQIVRNFLAVCES